MSQQKLAFIINKEFHYITVIQLTNQGFQCIAVFLYYLKTEKDGPCQLFMLSSHGFYYKDGRQCIFWNLPKVCFILSATVFKFLYNSITVFSLSDLLRFDQLRFCIRQCYASVCMWMNRMIEKETSGYVYYYHYLHAFSIMFSSIYVALHMRTPYLRFDSIKEICMNICRN